MASDMRGWDIFKDSKWLLGNLLNKYKIINLPTSGWLTDNAGSGDVIQLSTCFIVRTGTTANSRGLANVEAFGLYHHGWVLGMDWGKKLEIELTIARQNSDSEAVARFQLKVSSSEGALTSRGLGLEIQNFALYGESYGSSRGTVSLGDLTDGDTYHVKIVLVPNVRVEFWFDGVLAGTLTGDYVPTGVSAANHYFVVSIINGPTGGVDAVMRVGNIRVIQEW